MCGAVQVCISLEKMTTNDDVQDEKYHISLFY